MRLKLKRRQLWQVVGQWDHLPGSESPGRSWLQVLGSIAALLAISCALPTPWAVARALSGRATALISGTGATAVVETAMLLLAAVTVWTLLLWALAVVAAASLGRVPGWAGRIGRRVLSRIAPAVGRKLLVTVVGASMFSGAAACGTTAGSAPSAQGAIPPLGAAANSQDVVGSQHIAGLQHVAGLQRAHATVADSVGQPVAGSARSWIAVEGSVVHLLTGATHPDPQVFSDGRQRRPDPPETADPHLPSASVDLELPHPTPVGGRRPTENPVDVDWPSTPPTSAEPVVVLRGDSLWEIAARHLPGGASPSQIDRAWHRWYAANAAVIGPSPDLILPGQILLPPSTETGDSP